MKLVSKILIVLLMFIMVSCSVEKHYNEFVDSVYYDENGQKIYNNWKEISGNWYYFDGQGKKMTNTWIENYYVDSNGIMIKNTEKNINGKTYVFDFNGVGKEKPFIDLVLQNNWNNPLWALSGSSSGQYVNISNLKLTVEEKSVYVNMDIDVLKIKGSGDCVFKYRVLDEKGFLICDAWVPGKIAKAGDKYHLRKELWKGREAFSNGGTFIIQLY